MGNLSVGHIIGGIGGLIVLYLVMNNASNFNSITKGIAGSSQGLIQTLQGR